MTVTEWAPDYALCEAGDGESVRRNVRAHVVLVKHARFPGFCRAIWNNRVAGQTDLSDNDRHWLMELVSHVRHVLCAELAPDKINLTSFDNFVPHLH